MSYLVKVYHLKGSNCLVTDKDLIGGTKEEDYVEINLLVSNQAIDRLNELRNDSQ